ncbi:MAG: hypothetical protein ABI442_17140 [Gemmatimonadaceae bacterium]
MNSTSRLVRVFRARFARSYALHPAAASNLRVALAAAFIASASLLVPACAHAQVGTVSLLDYHTAVPADWTPRAASSSMRLAEYVVAPLPSAPNAGGAEVVVYFFGKGQGGNVEANLTRWKAQFSNPDGSSAPETITRDSAGAFPITFAEYRGTYARGIGAGDAANAKPGQTLLAGIAETPKGTLFIQLFGPTARVSVERETLMRFVRGLK